MVNRSPTWWPPPARTSPTRTTPDRTSAADPLPITVTLLRDAYAKTSFHGLAARFVIARRSA